MDSDSFKKGKKIMLMFTAQSNSRKENRSKFQKKQRESGVEILRIIAACMVIWLHTTLPWGMPLATEGINKFILHIFEVIAIPAVDVFILISGYFIADKSYRSIGKPVSLLFQMIVLKLMFFFPGYVMRYPQSSFNTGVFLPNDYFISLYIAIYFLSPYINFVIKGLNLKECRTLLITCAILLSLYPIIWDYINLYTGLNIDGISTVSRWNNDTGQNIATFSLVYLIGALIKKTQFEKLCNWRQALLVWAITSILLLVIYLFDERFTDDVFGCVSLFYHNPLVIIQAISLFLVFKNIRIRSNIINRLAAAAFTCYLLQGKILGRFHIAQFLQENPIVLLTYYLSIAIIIYSISYLVYLMYNVCTIKIINKLERFKIRYYD